MVKDLGATNVVARVNEAKQECILRRIGVEQYILPERAIATQVADHITWPYSLESLRIDDDRHVIEITVPEAKVGSRNSAARQYDVFVVAAQNVLQGRLNPGDLPSDDYVILIGTDSRLEGFHRRSLSALQAESTAGESQSTA